MGERRDMKAGGGSVMAVVVGGCDDVPSVAADNAHALGLGLRGVFPWSLTAASYDGRGGAE